MPTKPPIASDKQIRDAIRKRIQDETLGINSEYPNHPGAGIDFGSPAKKKYEVAPAPDISELGLGLSVRREIEKLSGWGLTDARDWVRMIKDSKMGSAALNLIEKLAAREREAVNDKIKVLLTEHVPTDVPVFQAGPCRVARYYQSRSSFSQDVMRDTLLSLGVKPAIIVKAMEAATTVNKIVSLRVSTGEEES